MGKDFNVAGPCRADLHYMLPFLRRLPDVRWLVEGQHYFVVHAPRQSGKTTAIRHLAAELTAEGRFAAAALSVEAGAAFEDPGQAAAAILGGWTDDAWTLPSDLQPPPWRDGAPGSRIGSAIGQWAATCPRPLVLLLDEVDGLYPKVLAMLLHQLRQAFARRPARAPWSLALVGMRDVRDYVLASGGTGRHGRGSPFNVSSRSLTLPTFAREEIAELYAQHTAATGQEFLPDSVDRAADLTGGQPWLVNAIADVCVRDLVPDRTAPIDARDVERAAETVTARAPTHLDSLAQRLLEPRVQGVIEPILLGELHAGVAADDIRYVVDLGLVRRDADGVLLVSNPIYRELIPHALAEVTRASLPRFEPSWLDERGAFDPDRLLRTFVAFWRQHGEALMGTAPYHEAAPHLVLMAFLHRVVNSGGSVEREYAVGTRRLDICVRYGGLTLAIEVKVWRPNQPDPLGEGLVQLDAYMRGLCADCGWLVIFDRRPGAPPLSQRTAAAEARTPGGAAVTVVRA